MDIHAVDSSGEEADIEIQRQDRGADSRRARLHSAILDSSMLKTGQEFDKIADSYVIFITENDIYGDGEPIRLLTRRCDQKPGMLVRAAKDYNIDLSQSYMAGDDEKDMEFAEKYL